MRQVLRALSLWGVFSVVALCGCGQEEHTERLKLSAFETRAVAVDRPLELSGSELPAGAEVQLVLHGVMHAPAEAERSLRLLLKGRVLSPERIQVSAEELVETLGRGSFEGRLEVRATDATAQVFSGSLPHVAFDVDGPTVLVSEQLRKSAAGVLRALGIEASNDDALVAGLVVAALRADGAAVRAGLRVADVIEAVNGVRVHALVDFAPAPLARSLQLQVRSPGGLQRALAVSLSPTAGLLLEARTLRWFVLGCPLLLLTLWLSPWPALRSFSWRVLSQLRAAYAPAALAAEKLGVALSCLCGGVLAMLLPLLDASALLLAHAGIFVWLQARRRPAGFSWVGHVAVLWLGMLCTAALSGTRSLLGIGNDQGALPWEWNLFTRPPLALAFVLCVWHAGCLHRRTGVQSPASRSLDTFGRALLAALLSALFLAGSQSGLEGVREAAALGSVVLALKSLCVFGLIQRVSALDPQALPRLARVSATLGLPLATGAWLWFAPSHEQELGLGVATLLVSLLGMALALVERASLRRKPLQLRTRTMQLPAAERATQA